MGDGIGLRLESMSPDECFVRLEGASVGRIGLSIQALPVIVAGRFG
jgi:hypothetical protein